MYNYLIYLVYHIIILNIYMYVHIYILYIYHIYIIYLKFRKLCNYLILYISKEDDIELI